MGIIWIEERCPDCDALRDVQYSRDGLDRSIAEHVAELTTEGKKQ